MKILALNCGSSSLKFSVFDMKHLHLTASGVIEQIGEDIGNLRIKPASIGEEIKKTHIVKNHAHAVEIMSDLLEESGVLKSFHDLDGIGHRVVHGGEKFHEPVIIDSSIIKTIEELVPLAPLHNPANLAGIKLTMKHAGNIPQVAVFDTAFHQKLPDYAFIYALPLEIYEKHRIRRYGFHGTSHLYVSKKAAEYLNTPYNSARIITLHLGNGVSASAIKNGRSIDTSMGFTPLEGLVMGTRCGDIDPAIPLFLAREKIITENEDIIETLDDLLNRRSGLLGICGDNDMRNITSRASNGDEKAELALKVFCYRIKKYIGAYMAALGGADCIVFTGGIGENSAIVRKMVCSGLEEIGILIDSELNKKIDSGETGLINSTESRIKIAVIPTDEELEIATQTKKLISRVKQ